MSQWHLAMAVTHESGLKVYKTWTSNVQSKGEYRTLNTTYLGHKWKMVKKVSDCVNCAFNN